MHIYIHTYILTTNTLSLTLCVHRGKTVWGFKPGRGFSPETKSCQPWSGTLNLQSCTNINVRYLSHAICGISHGSPCRPTPSEFGMNKVITGVRREGRSKEEGPYLCRMWMWKAGLMVKWVRVRKMKTEHVQETSLHQTHVEVERDQVQWEIRQQIK